MEKILCVLEKVLLRSPAARTPGRGRRDRRAEEHDAEVLRMQVGRRDEQAVRLGNLLLVVEELAMATELPRT